MCSRHISTELIEDIKQPQVATAISMGQHIQQMPGTAYLNGNWSMQHRPPFFTERTGVRPVLTFRHEYCTAAIAHLFMLIQGRLNRSADVRRNIISRTPCFIASYHGVHDGTITWPRMKRRHNATAQLVRSIIRQQEQKHPKDVWRPCKTQHERPAAR